MKRTAEQLSLGGGNEVAGRRTGRPARPSPGTPEPIALSRSITDSTEAAVSLREAAYMAAPPGQVAMLHRLQRTVGNRAVAELLGSSPARRDHLIVQREPAAVLGATPTTKAETDYEAAVKTGRWSDAATSLVELGDPEIKAHLLQLNGSQLADLYDSAFPALGLPKALRILVPLRMLGVMVGHEKRAMSEVVGGWEYGGTGEYEYRITPQAIEVRVNINFVPDEGVTTPVSTWFGYVKSTWNHYTAVDQNNRQQKRRIDFQPIAATGMHTVKVHDGNGRANAGEYYARDNRASSTVPHEFGHLIGLEDEYERSASDYTRVTGEATPAGDATQRDLAKTIATEMHDVLFQEEKWLEWHETATKRRKDAVSSIIKNRHLPKYYSTPLSRQVAAEYKAAYSSELSADIVAQIDVDKDPNYRDWREATVGVFEFTNASIMGNPDLAVAGTPEHDHPVQPRHVRHFAKLVQDFLGHGNWQPEADH